MENMEILAKHCKEIYHIEDKRSGYVIATFLTASEAEAERNFQNELKSEDSMLSKYPDDYVLVHDGKIEHTTYIFNCEVKTTTMVTPVVEK